MDILALFNRFKVGDSLFKASFKIAAPGIPLLPEEEDEKKALQMMAVNFAKYILSNNPLSITKQKKDGSTFIECELLVFTKKDFKAVMEAAMQMVLTEAVHKTQNPKPPAP